MKMNKAGAVARVVVAMSLMANAVMAAEVEAGKPRQKFTDAPVLLIKTAWCGKSLNTDFRPPSPGPYVFNETQLTAFQKQGRGLAEAMAELLQFKEFKNTN